MQQMIKKKGIRRRNEFEDYVKIIENKRNQCKQIKPNPGENLISVKNSSPAGIQETLAWIDALYILVLESIDVT